MMAIPGIPVSIFIEKAINRSLKTKPSRMYGVKWFMKVDIPGIKIRFLYVAIATYKDWRCMI